MITIIYYTSNREDEGFEDKIKARLLEVAQDKPIISVSHRPIDFGQNICVGDVGLSDSNIYRQVQIGCEAAKTPLVGMAEADCLYPPGFFDFVPDEIDMCYRYANVYVLQGTNVQFRPKPWGFFAQISGREYLIRAIKKRLKRRPMWDDDTYYKNYDPKQKDVFRKHKGWKEWTGEIAAISIKTPNGMRPTSKAIKGLGFKELPYWGNAEDLKKELLTGEIGRYDGYEYFDSGEKRGMACQDD